LDGFQWYCDECNALLYEKYISLTDIVAQLPPLFEDFWKDEDGRTCKECNAYLEKP
ncbi:MAG: 3-hydroxyanthranilate 3,4-dioxygenase, partial [Candidatus Marinimicrobia bacterium]|nr:3-hydroxyanthranilate 3,4-dioxygenase [Candidatus Neomarinimicrobiota bacterium]